jgi:tetratricopeptide (TPR) repeat protein
MSALSSLFLAIALVLAVVIGPQTRPWTWGPAMLALGISVAAALPEFWRKAKCVGDFWLLAFAAIVVGWFTWRTYTSPVAQLGEADLMLLAGAVGAFISIRAIEGNRIAERILLWGIALLLIANVFVIGKQVIDPSYSPLFKTRAGAFPSGFYAHYNEAANYLIASSLIIASAALLGKYSSFTRVAWGLIAIAGLAAVYFTKSRGGILGAAVGFGLLSTGALLFGKRQNTRWFGPAIILVPLVAIAIGVFVLSGWENRNGHADIGRSLDNDCRLYFLGMAVSCIGAHPLEGGGSRSFSWESNQFADVAAQGVTAFRKAEHVHNEIVQAATDYGLIGFGLLISLLASLSIMVIVKILFEETNHDCYYLDSWRLGGIAALSGMLVQSSFSFVFHLFPGVILLGICLGGMACNQTRAIKTYRVVSSKVLLSLIGVGSLMLLAPLGWRSTTVTQTLWATHLSKFEKSTNESKLDALTKAISIWSHYSFYQERAAIFQSMALLNQDTTSSNSIASAISDYQKAQNLHAHDAEIAINLANLLSKTKQEEDAEKNYESAIQLQGGMEVAYQSHIFFVKHLMTKAARQFDLNDQAQALQTLEKASEQIEQSAKKMVWWSHDVSTLKPIVYENLGIAREAMGKYSKALESYDIAAALPGGAKANYRAGYLLSKMGESAWRSLRPSDSLAKFLEAKKRISQAQQLPDGVTEAQRVELIAHIDRWIAFLNEMKVK